LLKPLHYETVFAEMIADGSLSFEVVSFDGKPWYEIDTIDDLAKAEKLFSSNNHRTRSTLPLSKPGFLEAPLINTVLSPLKPAGVLSGAK
jgi:NDP-sugar pyrophosphorylase family protein